MRDSLTVVVADDNRHYRAGVVRALRRWPGIAVVGEADDGAGALELARRLRPRVLIVDDRMPVLSGFEVARAVTADPALHAVRVVMLSGSVGADLTAAAAAAGAVARLDKTTPRDRICAAVERAGGPSVVATAGRPGPPEVPTSATDEEAAHDERLSQAVARERTRLADALHDGPVQELAAISQDCAAAVDGDEQALGTLRADLGRVTEELRAMSSALHEQSLGELGLRQAVEQLVRALRLGGRLTIALDVDPAVDDYTDPLVRETVRELLINVARHAEATMVAVSVALSGPELQIRVVDDGVGFDPARAQAAREAGHLGLQRLERGAARLGGRFRMAAAVPVGTIATVLLPAAALQRRPGPRDAAARPHSVDRDGQSSGTIMRAAAARDGVAHGEDLASLARDRAADARDVLSEEGEPRPAPGDDTVVPSGPGDAGHARSSRARAHDDRDHAARDRERGALERLLAAADRLALVAQLTTAESDALTGARTRSAGLHDLDREIARGHRNGEPVVVAVVDVVGLKATNDAHGHDAGDRLLQRVVATIRDRVRSYDLVVRLGGDEFLCVMPGLSIADAEARFLGVSATLAAPPAAAIATGFARLTRQDIASSLIARADRDLTRRRSDLARGAAAGAD